MVASTPSVARPTPMPRTPADGARGARPGAGADCADAAVDAVPPEPPSLPKGRARAKIMGAALFRRPQRLVLFPPPRSVTSGGNYVPPSWLRWGPSPLAAAAASGRIRGRTLKHTEAPATAVGGPSRAHAPACAGRALSEGGPRAWAPLAWPGGMCGARWRASCLDQTRFIQLTS